MWLTIWLLFSFISLINALCAVNGTNDNYRHFFFSLICARETKSKHRKMMMFFFRKILIVINDFERKSSKPYLSFWHFEVTEKGDKSRNKGLDIDLKIISINSKVGAYLTWWHKFQIVLWTRKQNNPSYEKFRFFSLSLVEPLIDLYICVSDQVSNWTRQVK